MTPKKDKKKGSANHSQADPRPAEIRRSPEFKTLYCNHVQAGYTAFDISLILSHAAGTKERVTIDQQAQLFISPLEARVLEAILAIVLKQHEAQFGKIHIPPGVIPVEAKTE